MSDELRNVFEGIYVHGVPREMTPELAQQVLDAATGTPFEERTNALEALDAYTVHPAVKELLIEAPALARVVAGLTEEWGVQFKARDGWRVARLSWSPTKGHAQNVEESWQEDGYETRLVRRWVSAAEVAE